MASSTVTSVRSEEHTSELQSHVNLVCRLLLEKKNHRRPPGPRHPAAHHPPLHRHPPHPRRREVHRAGGHSPLRRGVEGAAGHVRFFFNDPATTEIYTLSLHDALPI